MFIIGFIKGFIVGFIIGWIHAEGGSDEIRGSFGGRVIGCASVVLWGCFGGG